MTRFRGATPSLASFLLSAALEVAGVESRWLAVLLAVLGSVMLGAWAVPFFQREWAELTADLRLSRLTSSLAPMSLSIADDGRVSGNITVSGRFWFQQPVVLDDIYAVFWRRSRWTRRRRELLRATIFQPRQALGYEITGKRLEPGEAVCLDRTLFSTLNEIPARPISHGRFDAELRVDLRVPHRVLRLKLEEAAE